MSRLARSLVDTWNRACVVPVLLFLGERALRSGRTIVARRRFASCVRRAPLCFRGHFGLARTLAALGDSEGARRELTIARHLAPSRYRELRRGLPEPYRHEATVPMIAGGFREIPTGTTPDRLARPLLDDFASAAERERFRNMGPIRDDEARDVDWDRIVDELTRRDA